MRSCLRELSDVEEQRELWLGRRAGEQSSFTEVICRLFDDSGLSLAIERGSDTAELTPEAVDLLNALSLALRKVPESASPDHILQDPNMPIVRDLARRLLLALPQ